MERKILLTDCPDAKGLIAKITNICYKHQLNIIKNDEFVDHEHGRFFMRTELEGRFNDVTLLARITSYNVCYTKLLRVCFYGICSKNKAKTY